MIILFALAAVSPLIGRNATVQRLFLLAAPFNVVLLLVSKFADVREVGSSFESIAWVPSLGVQMSLRLDGLAAVFLALIGGVGFFIQLYAIHYFKDVERLSRYCGPMLLFTASMVGVVLADDLISLFVFWELTSISSFMLIGLDRESASARWSALQALLITGGGGLALLAGVLLLRQVTGSFSITEISAQSDLVQQSPMYLAILILFCLGAFTKSAQFPFHFWLPGAMAAPAPVSAYLHSATMVKAGVYLLMRMHASLGGTAAWIWLVATAGAVTFFWGAYLAFRSFDLKSVLANTTVSALGLLVMVTGVGTPMAFKGGVVFLLVHALYKAPLFLTTGTLEKAFASRHLLALRGLGRSLWQARLTVFLAALSMAGLPPMLGFISKELIYESGLLAESGRYWLLGCSLLANAMTFAIATKIFVVPFVTRPVQAPPHKDVIKKKLNWGLLWPPLILSSLGLLLGVMPQLVSVHLLTPALLAILGQEIVVKLALWHGLNVALAVSVLTVLIGAALFFLRLRFIEKEHGLDFSNGAALPADPAPWAASAFKSFFDSTLAFGRTMTGFLQNGQMSWYLILLISVTTTLTTFALRGLKPNLAVGSVSLLDAAIVLIMVSTAIFAALSRNYLSAVIALGGTGYSVALLFVSYGAPDLALTQFAVESLSILFFILVLPYLPKQPLTKAKMLAARLSETAKILLSVSFGLVTMLVAWWSMSAPIGSRLTPFFAEASYLQALGRNVVNVILVDFRALDTMGEITVLLLAALGVLVIFSNTSSDPSRPSRPPLKSRIFSLIVSWAYPPMLVLALFFFIRGHNAPGGGFVGGLVISAALALLAFCDGSKRMLQVMRLSPVAYMSIGLLVAVLSALLPPFFEKDFMTGVWLPFSVPVLGKLGTPVLFDLGVMFLVSGMVTEVLSRMKTETKT